MSQRKKRLMILVVGVLLFFLISFVVGGYFLDKNEKNMRAYYESLCGVWSGEHSIYKIKVYRVTDAHVMASLVNRETDEETMLFAAMAKEEQSYRFELDQKWSNEFDVTLYKKKGVISIQNSSVLLEIMDAREENVKYRATMTEQTPLPKREQVSLQSYLGKETEVPESCHAFRDREGKVWRIQADVEMENSHHQYELDGINQYSLETDCENKWGEPVDSLRVSEEYKKVVYEKDGCRYTVFFGKNGLVTELSCAQIREDFRTDGEFIMQGNTLLHYEGDYIKDINLNLPKDVQTIATGAFTASHNVYKREKTPGRITLSLSPELKIEKEAFRHCGKMVLTLQEGWKIIPESVFAHMAPISNAKKRNWISINLPKSIEKLEKDAFNLDDGTVPWKDYLSGITTEEVIPVKVHNLATMREIGEGSLRGVAIIVNGMEQNPYLTTFTGGGLLKCAFSDNETFIVPENVRKLKKDAFTIIDSLYGSESNFVIKLPEKLEEIEEGAIRTAGGTPQVEADKNSKYFYSDSFGWLFSKDRTELYMAALEPYIFWGSHAYENSIDKVKQRYPKNKIIVPRRVKNIHAYAFSGVPSSGEWNSIMLPSGLEKMNRNAFCYRSYHLYFQGEIPEFYGEFSEDTLASLPPEEEGVSQYYIYVKKGNGAKFLQSLFRGQKVTEEQKKAVRDRIKEY